MREIVVPGSIGNVGPGFDTLGLAIALYLRVTVTRVVKDRRGEVVYNFAGMPPLGENRLATAFGAVPPRGRRPSSIEVTVASEIPQRAGLGSSAAATIAGLKLRELVDGRKMDPTELLRVAAGLEGHPDNVAAILTGGLTSSCVTADGVEVGRWPWPPAWKVVMATPDVQLRTAVARRVLPAKVPLEAVRFNLQRTAMLLEAVQNRRPGLFAEALADRAHQPYRERLVPGLRDALEFRHRDVMGVCLSGSGPSVAFFARRNLRGVARAVENLYHRLQVPCTVRVLRVHQ